MSETMDPTQFEEQLRQIHSNTAERRSTLEESLVKYEADKGSLLQQIAELERGIGEIEDETERVEAELRDLILDENVRINDLAREALEESWQSIQQLQTVLVRWEELQHKRDALLRDQPESEEKLRKFMEFTERLREVRRTLDPILLEQLETVYSQQQKQLASLLQVKESIDGLSPQESVQFCLIAAKASNESSVWVLPLPVAGKISGVSTKKVYTRLFSACQNFLRNKGVALSEDFGEWESFISVSLDIQTTSTDLIEGLTAALSSSLREIEVFSKVVFSALVLEIPYASWSLSTHENAETELVQSTTRHEDLEGLSRNKSEIRLPLSESSKGWYRDEDVVSWEVGSAEGENSGWNSQCSRLRTLLIRMLGKGYVGQRAISIEALWKPLPAPHDEAMRHGLERLLEFSVFHEVEGHNGGGPLVALNPGLMPKVESFINHNVDDFWQGITG